MQQSERIVQVGEFSINCSTAGMGEHLVLLHGSDHRESWKVWNPLLQLGDSYSLIMPDLIGYGKSSTPAETPDYKAQAHMIRELLERMSVDKASLMGTGWGGQVALEVSLQWPDLVRTLVLISSAYDKEQLRRLGKLRKPTLIVYAEDDMVTQLKSGYLLRDAIGTSRLEVLEPVARDPSQGFTMAHKLETFRAPQVLQLVKLFLSKPEDMIAEPPEMEDELRGMALKRDREEGAGD